MLLDTSGLLAFLHQDENCHQRAVEFVRSANRRMAHNYVLAALVALCQARKLPRKQVLEFLHDLQDNESVEVYYVQMPLHRQALELLRHRLDKTWSLCDAVSFILMSQIGITEALTTDKHFEQAGFVKLLSAV
jgi:predicted nucleic acid-binding protein